MFINGRRTLPILLCLVWSHSRCTASISMPRKLHCLAQVSLQQVVQDGGADLGAANVVANRLHVEEFLDLDRRRSTVSLTNERTSDVSIYYNKLNARGDLPERKSTVYEPARSVCTSQRIIHWPLAELRKVATYLHSLRSLASESYEDTPLGPSALLHAVELNPRRFQFREQLLSKATLGHVNVFSSQVEFRTLGKIEKVQVLVHMHSRAYQPLQASSTLAEAFPPGASQSIASNLRFVGACRSVDASATSGGTHSLQEHEFCSPDRLLFGVHFDVIERHVEGTLTGRRLEELGGRYEFEREPHLQPVGIGCWDPDTNLGLQKSLLEGGGGGGGGGGPLRLSAQSVSSLGPSGITFVAYDGRAHLLRLDRNGRASVYDLAQAKAYHLVRTQGAPEPHRCLVLALDESSGELATGGGLVAARDHVLEQLVGLGPTRGNEAHYLGTRVIDHQEYEAYEKELRLVGVPILLQAHRYKLTGSSNKRLLATYYTRAQAGAPELVNLHYIELWEFERASATRKLVNRVTFTEFSWSVGDLEPTGGARSAGSNVFDLAACRQGRAAQAQLKLAYVQDGDTRGTALTETQLRDHSRELGDHLQQVVASTLEVSRLNLADVKVAIGSVQATNRLLEVVASGTLIEMRAGSSATKLLGVARHDQPEMHKYAVRYLPNRHALEECKLDSLELGRKLNWLAYCAHLTLCVLLTPDHRLTEALKRPLDDVPSDARDECRVYSLKYAELDQASGPGARRALEQAQANEVRLRETPLDLEIGYLDEVSGEQKTANFRAKLRTSSLELLDPIGARLANNMAALEGLSYSLGQSIQQDNQARTGGANFRWLASRPDDEPASIFGRCQLACQLDEFCGSFSVCVGGPSAGDCILSPLRLAGGELMDTLVETKRASRDENFEFRAPGVLGSPGEQTFVFEHRPGCSLHERDFLADFQAARRVDVSRTLAQVTTEQPEDTRAAERDEQHLTLEECAGSSFERSMGDSDKSESLITFTYCPLESLCILEGDGLPHLRSEFADELSRCLVYSRQASGAYEKKTLTHLVVRPSRPAGGRENSRTSQAEDYKSRVTLRTFYTHDEEQCARECSLPTSGCLSLDVCQGGGGGKHLCLLYAIRSPMAKRGAYLPLLEREQSLLTEHNTVLANNPMCNHFLLKRPYFETKLKHLLAREKMRAASSGALAELANKIELADDARSKQFDALASSDGAKQEDADGHAIEIIYDQRAVSFTVGSIYTLQLAVGLVIGSLGATYRLPLKNAASHLCLWAQFMMRPPQRDITPLVTRDQL